eukprot:7187823-Alexandrium_andersonii.AAC.1
MVLPRRDVLALVDQDEHALIVQHEVLPRGGIPAQLAVGLVALALASQEVHVVQREALPKRDVHAEPAVGRA